MIDDFDKYLISGYKLVKQVSGDPNKYHDLDTYEKQHAFYHRTPKTNGDKLTIRILQACNTFGGTGKGDVRKDKPSNPYSKLKTYKNTKTEWRTQQYCHNIIKAVIKTVWQ